MLLFWKILFSITDLFRMEVKAIPFAKNDWPYERLMIDIHILRGRNKYYSERGALNMRFIFVYLISFN